MANYSNLYFRILTSLYIYSAKSGESEGELTDVSPMSTPRDVATKGMSVNTYARRPSSLNRQMIHFFLCLLD